MDESITNIRRLYQQFVTGGSTDTALLQEMRLWRATIRGDRAGYEKANAELRATFEAVAAFALQVALTALLTPAAAALLRVAEGAEAAVMAARAVKLVRGVLVNTISTVGANAAVHDNYGTAALEHDLLGGLGSLVGAGTVGKLSGLLGKPFVTSLVGREAISAAQTVAGIEATALLEGRSLTADLTVRNFLIMHAQGKVMHAVGEAVTPEERAERGGAGTERGAASEPGATEPGAEPARLEPEALEPEASDTATSMALPEPAPAPAAPSGRGPLQMSGAELTEFAAEVLRRPVKAMEGKAFFYDDVASYEAEFQRRFPGRRPPGGGYFDPNVGDLHVSPRSNLLTVLHEAIHKVAGETSPLAKQLLGQYLNEGITEEITRSRLGERAGKHAYDRNVAIVEVLQDRLGVSVVENAILHGDYRSFREAVRARLGGSEAETLEFMRLLQSVGPTSHDSPALKTALDMLDGRAEPRGAQPPGEPPSSGGPEAGPSEDPTGPVDDEMAPSDESNEMEDVATAEEIIRSAIDADAGSLSRSLGRSAERLRSAHLQEKISKLADARARRGKLNRELDEIGTQVKEALRNASVITADPDTAKLPEHELRQLAEPIEKELRAARARADELARALDEIEPRSDEEIAETRATAAVADRAQARSQARLRGQELVDQLVASGTGTGAGRSGGHGTPFTQAGAQLIRDANALKETDPLREALKVEGQRLIDRGNAINHRGGGIGS
jgi:polyhydroxyalkanoate synthesis regulator phasin